MKKVKDILRDLKNRRSSSKTKAVMDSYFNDIEFSLNASWVEVTEINDMSDCNKFLSKKEEKEEMEILAQAIEDINRKIPEVENCKLSTEAIAFCDHSRFESIKHYRN